MTGPPDFSAIPPPPPLDPQAPLPPSTNTALTPGVKDPYTIDSGTIGAYEMQAQSLNQASIATYGSPLNPQALLELLRTGASEPTLAAIASGDPEYASLLSSAPAGLAPRLTTSTQAAQGLDLSKDQTNQTIFTWDDKSQLASRQQARQSSDASINALDEMPSMNIGYMNGVRSGTDANRTKRWQIYLKSHSNGMLDHNFQVTGQWDQATDRAFSAYMVARFMPEAVYGKNQAGARVFMNEIGVDVPKLIQAEGRDGLQKDVFLKWLVTQDQTRAREALSTFVGNYGEANIPDSYKNLTGSWVDSFQDTLSGIPLLGRVISPVENLFSLNKLDKPWDFFKDNRDVRTDYVMKTINPADAEALQSITDEAKHSVGWFGAIDAYDRSRTRLVLGLLWDFHDHGLDFGKFHNPVDNFTNNFDPASDYGRQIAVGQNDMFGHMPWVSGWFNEHESVKGLANFGANLLDDPLSYTGVGFIGKGSFKVASALHDFGEASAMGKGIISYTDKVWKPYSVKDGLLGDFVHSPAAHVQALAARGIKASSSDVGWEIAARDRLDTIMVNKRNTKALDEMAHIVTSPDVFEHDMLKLLHLSDGPEVEKHLLELKKITSRAERVTDKATLALIHDAVITKIAEIAPGSLQHANFAHNYYEAMKSITPAITARAGLGRLNRMLAHGSIELSNPMIEARMLPVMDNITKVGHALGMKPEEMRPFIDQARTAGTAEDRLADVYEKFNQHIAQTFEQHPQWSQIEFNGKHGLEAFTEFRNRTRINPADPMAEIPVRAGDRAFAPTQTSEEEIKAGKGVTKEQSTGPAKAPVGRERDAQQTAKAIENGVAMRMAVIKSVLSPEEVAALGTGNTIADLMGAIQALSGKIAKTTNPADRQMLEDHLLAANTELSMFQAHSTELGQIAPDGESVARPAFTSQLRYRIASFATPAEIIAFTNKGLRTSEAMQSKLRLDSFRSFWAQAEIARISSAFRITLGDEISRFFFYNLMNGHSIAAFRYLGQMGLGVPAKAYRKATGSSFGAVNVDRRLATSALGLAGVSSPVGHALFFPGSPYYNKALAHALWYTFGKDKFTKEWMHHWAGNIDIEQELLASEKKWFKSHSDAQGHLDKAASMMEERGYHGASAKLADLRTDWAERAKGGGYGAIKGPDGVDIMPELDHMDLGKIHSDARYRTGDKKLKDLVNKVDHYRQVKDAEALKTHLEKMGDQHLLDLFNETYQKAAVYDENAIHIGFDSTEVRDQLNNYNQLSATGHLHKMMLLTPQRLDQYRELATKLREGSTDSPVWKDWKEEFRGSRSHEDVAKMIDRFVKQHDNPETIKDMDRMRRNFGLSDLLAKEPISHMSGQDMMHRKQGVVDAIEALFNREGGHNEADLAALNESLREIDPSIGQWHGGEGRQRDQARQELSAARYDLQHLQRDKGYFGYMSARQWAERQHMIMADLMKHPKMREWTKKITDSQDSFKGADEVSRKAGRLAEAEAERRFVAEFNPALNDILRKRAHDPEHLGLPVIAQPLMNHDNLSAMGRMTQKFFDTMHHSVTGAMVNYARQVGMETIRSEQLALLKKHRPDWFDAEGHALPEAEWRANSYAMAWVQRNTYQGQRTVTGGLMRNAFPFWGANANMSRFWMRQIGQHKHWQAPFLHTMDTVDQNQATGGVHLELPQLNWMMSKITGNAGEDMSVDPLKPFFFTSDGIGGFIPGLGPYLSLGLNMMASHDPHMVDAALGAFGPVGDVWKQHITGAVSNPLLSWTPGLVEGAAGLAGLKVPQIPFITDSAQQQDRQVLANVREQQAQRDDQQLGTAPNPDQQVQDATHQAGAENALQGLLSFLLPVGAKAGDQRATAVKDQLSKWDAATDPQKTKMLAKAFGQDPSTVDSAFQSGRVADWVAQNPQNPANLLLYFDRRTSEDDKRAIAFSAPWVVDYATSKYDTSKSATQLFGNAQEFGNQVDAGNIHTLAPGEYLNQIAKNREFNQAWALYGQLKQHEYDWMQQTGNSSQSQAAKAYREHFFNPQFKAIADRYQDWATQFAQQSRKDWAGLLVSTRPISSVMSWEVIPQFGEFDTKKVALWRQVFRDREDAVAAIREARQGGVTGLHATQLNILAQFQQRLVQYAQQDPGFAAELDQFHYGRIEDLINLESMGEQ